jgi:hypothetical protein
LRTILFERISRVNLETGKLQAAFPKINIWCVLNAPYTHVSIRVTKRFLAPITDWAVLSEDYSSEMEITFSELEDDFPSDHLVAQLALIS